MKKLNFIQSAEQIKDPDVIDIHEEDIDMEFFDHIDDDRLKVVTNHSIAIRGAREFEGKAIFLSDCYDYVVGKDSNNMPILIPLKQKS